MYFMIKQHLPTVFFSSSFLLFLSSLLLNSHSPRHSQHLFFSSNIFTMLFGSAWALTIMYISNSRRFAKYLKCLSVNRKSFVVAFLLFGRGGFTFWWFKFRLNYSKSPLKSTINEWALKTEYTTHTSQPAQCEMCSIVMVFGNGIKTEEKRTRWMIYASTMTYKYSFDCASCVFFLFCLLFFCLEKAFKYKREKCSTNEEAKGKCIRHAHLMWFKFILAYFCFCPFSVSVFFFTFVNSLFCAFLFSFTVYN